MQHCSTGGQRSSKEGKIWVGQYTISLMASADARPCISDRRSVRSGLLAGSCLLTPYAGCASLLSAVQAAQYDLQATQLYCPVWYDGFNLGNANIPHALHSHLQHRAPQFLLAFVLPSHYACNIFPTLSNTSLFQLAIHDRTAPHFHTTDTSLPNQRTPQCWCLLSTGPAEEYPSAGKSCSPKQAHS